MNQKMSEFLSAGMQSYKQATAVMISFVEATETRLQEILTSRTPDKWGRFVPSSEAAVKSTRTWKEYPHISARIAGKLGGAAITITIAINWYQSETEYPFYEIYIQGDENEEAGKTPLISLNEFPRGRQVRHVHTEVDTLRLVPDEHDFDLDRDFGILLDELLGLFDANIT
jgi:hypothetical protein